MSNPDFRTACDFVLKFGQYKDQTIDKAAESDAGLKYLDWLRGQPWLKDPLKKHLETYLNDPSIKADLEKLIK